MRVLSIIGLIVLIPCILTGETETRTVYNRDSNLTVPKAEFPIKIDGIIDEKAWENALTLELSNEISPGENTPAPVRTQCFITFDKNGVYVAFRAFDPEPSQVRAHLVDRDNAWQDDLVAIVFDTFNDTNRAFGFFINPLGVQTDEIWSKGGNEFDGSWDAIWHSAGHLTDFGYEVEVLIPFRALQFHPTSEAKTWGFSALRVYPRSQRHNIGLLNHNRNHECMICQFPQLTGFQEVKTGKTVELDPTVTYVRTDYRPNHPDGPMVKFKDKAEVGLSGHWSFTPNLTFSGAINPDFSQVEADAAQMDVNTQFSLYYDEKRPFFLEGIDFFRTQAEAVYTRAVAEPEWGIKLSGKEKKNVLALFSTGDRITNILLPGAEGSGDEFLDQRCVSSVFRYRRDFSNSSTLGFLVTDREGTDYHNRLAGVDGMIRITKSDTLSFQGLVSSTAYPEAFAQDKNQPDGNFNGAAMTLSYKHSRRSYFWKVSYDDFNPKFRADLGFIPQVDYREIEVEGGYFYWGKKESFLTRAAVSGSFDQSYKHNGDLLEREGSLDIELEGPLQSLLLVNFEYEKKIYAQMPFTQFSTFLMFQAKPSGTMEFRVSAYFGDELDYDNARDGRVLSIEPYLNLRLGQHLNLSASYSYNRLNISQGRLYLAQIAQLNMAYHFSKKLFFRGILQYRDTRRNPDLYIFEVDPRYRKLYAQMLLSYKLNPRTVFFLGYTDNFVGKYFLDPKRDTKTFFVKVGYALAL